MEKLVIGIDLGGTKIMSAIISSKGKILQKAAIATEASRGPKHVISNIKKSIDLLLSRSKLPLSKISAIGIGAPGPVSYEKGMIFNPPNLKGWRKVPLQKIIRAAFRKKVALENDASAAALGEATFGGAKGIKNFIYVTISTGIGGGLIVENKLYKGSIGGSGEVGHMVIKTDGPLCGCGNRGCLEAMASGSAMARRAAAEAKAPSIILKLARGDRRNINAKTVEDAARSGDRLAKQIIRDAAYNLGVGVANLINIFAPDMILLGGGVMKMGKPFLNEIKRTAKNLSLSPAGEHVRIELAALGEEAGVLGAAALVL